MVIYHTIVTLKAGPLNVSQSNLASGTVHWILHCWPYNLSCVTHFPKCVLESWKEDKADIACGFSKLCHLLMGKDVTWPPSMIVQWAKSERESVCVSLGAWGLNVLCTVLNNLMVYSMCRPQLCVGLKRGRRWRMTVKVQTSVTGSSKQGLII